VVLHDNFLFLGSIARDNIISGRPSFTLSDAMLAAQLAGAEEFIERMPNCHGHLTSRKVPPLVRRSKASAGDRSCPDPSIHHPILDESTSALEPRIELDRHRQSHAHRQRGAH